MSIPEFTATKNSKSATFRLFDLVRDLQPLDEPAGDTALRMDLDLQMEKKWTDGTYWVRDQGQWPDVIRKSIRVFGMEDEADAVTALGASLNGKPEAQRAVLVAVKCFDLANDCTSVIDWGV